MDDAPAPAGEPGAAAVGKRAVVGDRGVLDGHRPYVADATADAGGHVAADRGVEDGDHSPALDATPGVVGANRLVAHDGAAHHP